MPLPLVPLLARMEVGDRGRRLPSGDVAASRLTPPGSLLFGPHLRLQTGRYRLHIACTVGSPRWREQPVLGVEVVAQNRAHVAWADYLARDLAGTATLDFEVPRQLGADGGNDIPFEFRFLHLSNASLLVSDVSLETLDAASEWRPRPEIWRVLRRLGNFLPIYLPGVLAVDWYNPMGVLSDRCRPPLILPAGQYRLAIRGRARRLGAGPALSAMVVTRRGELLAQGMWQASDIGAGQAVLDVTVPDDLASESGVVDPIDVRLVRHGATFLALDAVDLHRVAEAEPASAQARAARPSLLVVGNCQAALVAQALQATDGFGDRFRIVYHDARTQPYQLDRARRDIETCDVILTQDIQDWTRSPLREAVRPDTQQILFPCLRFASLWPFDMYNGMDDPTARLRDHPNFEFTYFDGLLGRLRQEIPNPQARLAAYRALAVDGLVDCRSLHRYEERRLGAMDRKFDVQIGADILENFRRRQMFYTTAHPNADLLVQMLQMITRQMGLRTNIGRPACLDSLKSTQIPVHPQVAALLDVRWATERTRYQYRGATTTWEAYVARYIAYYG